MVNFELSKFMLFSWKMKQQMKTENWKNEKEKFEKWKRNIQKMKKKNEKKIKKWKGKIQIMKEKNSNNEKESFKYVKKQVKKMETKKRKKWKTGKKRKNEKRKNFCLYYDFSQLLDFEFIFWYNFWNICLPFKFGCYRSVSHFTGYYM